MSFHSTLKLPGGVRKPCLPVLTGTGPYVTTPFSISQACLVARLTHASACGPHGAAAGCAVATGPVSATVEVAATNPSASTLASRRTKRIAVQPSLNRHGRRIPRGDAAYTLADAPYPCEVAS